MTPIRLPLPLSSSRDLFGKLTRDAELLGQEVTTDRFFNFVITGYSLIDWVKRDENLQMPDVEIRALRDNYWLRICGDLATASKHFELDKRKPVTRSASSMKGYGVGRYGHGAYGIGEEEISIVLNDNREVSLLELVRGVVEVWHAVFARTGT